MTKRIFISFVLAALLSLPALAALAQGEVDVAPEDLDGWTVETSGTASAEFVSGPDTPPLGTGSIQFEVGADGSSAAQIRNTEYSGTRLDQLTALTYSTYVTSYMNAQAPYIILHLDLNNDGSSDDLLFFEPYFQTGTYGMAETCTDTVPAQGDLVLNEWQDWNALDGAWWSLNGPNPGPPLVTIDCYLAENPDATIVNASEGGGGVRIVTGFGASTWPNFGGNADAFTIGVDGESTTYDFEQEIAPVVGCVDDATGALRVVGNAAECDANEAVLLWSGVTVDGAEQITACVNETSQNTRIVDDAAECSAQENVVQWDRGTGEGPQITACVDESGSRSRRAAITRIVGAPDECMADEGVVQWDAADDSTDGDTGDNGDDGAEDTDDSDDTTDSGSRSRRSADGDDGDDGGNGDTEEGSNSGGRNRHSNR